MNRLFIIGNVTKDPEIRATSTGKHVCTFTVAVNRRKRTEGRDETDFFRVSAWDAMGENCAKYLTKGKKVAVVGAVSVHSYTNAKGEPGANLEVMASEVEFLTPKSESVDQQTGMQKVEPEDMPY